MDELIPIIRQLYKNDVDRIIKDLKKYQKDVKVSDNPSPNTDWYKFLNLYCIYPDSIPGKKDSPLLRLIPQLTRIKDLGMTAMHILPFLDSPMVDKGFDVRNFTKIRKDLGTMTDMKKVVDEAHKVGIRLFMDMIFNHVSDEHEWFRKAQEGDEKYRNFFIYQKSKPRFVEKVHKDSAVWAEYIINGHKRPINIAFPEHTGEIPHWREGKDGYWYYHTYYPEQLDVNWRNPEVFLEFAKIVFFWSSMGFNFRLDAIPFVGKSAYKEVDDTPKFLENLLEAFRCIAENVNKETVFIVETYEKETTVMDYFGTSHKRQVKLGYNFHLNTYMWVSLVTSDSSFIWKKLQKLDNIPTHAEWINFLRNHDELSLSYLPDPLLKKVQKTLLKNGASFREGYGISGRTYSFLDSDEKRFLNAYLLLISMPGGLLIPYGDEIGKANIPLENLPVIDQKDTRNINRGPLTAVEINDLKGQRISARIKEFLKNRVHLSEYVNIWPVKIPAPKEVFAAAYEKGSSRLVILINLSNKVKKVQIGKNGYQTLLQLEQVKVTEKEILLPPYGGIWLEK
jgi:maltose alpha-D-glucosyltransferase/alpha-amylase